MTEIQKQIKGLWQVEQEILDVFHKVCSENNLRYSLAYGTLIGAVRHGGFIPWDDDIDLMMPREDYERLLQIWNNVAPEGYILMNGSKYADYTNNFSKITKDHTTFLQCDEDRSKTFHKGIFIDIFPGDRVAPGKVQRTIQYCACAANLLFSRGFASGSGGLIGVAEKILLRIPRRFHATLRNTTERFISKWNKCADAPYMFPCTIGCCKKYYPADLFNQMGSVCFNGKSYMAVADPDRILRIEYGDYMQLPPEEERVWKHHPILIDFERNLEEIDS